MSPKFFKRSIVDFVCTCLSVTLRVDWMLGCDVKCSSGTPDRVGVSTSFYINNGHNKLLLLKKLITRI